MNLTGISYGKTYIQYPATVLTMRHSQDDPGQDMGAAMEI
jgi:hypothetical protein